MSVIACYLSDDTIINSSPINDPLQSQFRFEECDNKQCVIYHSIFGGTVFHTMLKAQFVMVIIFNYLFDVSLQPSIQGLQ